jgi:MbtH protein
LLRRNDHRPRGKSPLHGSGEAPGEIVTENGNAGGGTATHQVLINDEEQYSLWPGAKPVPSGWRSVFAGSREDCLAHVDAVWTDMRPKSIRETTG